MTISNEGSLTAHFHMKLDSLQSLVHTVTFQSHWLTARWQAIGLSWLLAAGTGTQRMKRSPPHWSWTSPT